MNQPHRYSYCFRWYQIFATVVLLAGASAFFASLFGGFNILSALLALLAIALVVDRAASSQTLELTETAILLPSFPHRGRTRQVRYADIIFLHEHKVGRGHFLQIVTGQEIHKIESRMLPNLASYQTVRDALCTNVPVEKQAASVKTPPIARRENSVPTLRESMYLSPVALVGMEKRLLINPLLAWTEPEDYPRYRTHLVVTAKPLWRRRARAVTHFCLWFFPGLFLLLLIRQPVGTYLVMVPPMALLLAWLAWDNYHHPERCSKISFFPHDYVVQSGLQAWSMNYQDITGWSVVERSFENHPLYFLILENRSRRDGAKYVRTWAFADLHLREPIVQLMREKQLPHSPLLKLPWELNLAPN